MINIHFTTSTLTIHIFIRFEKNDLNKIFFIFNTSFITFK